MDVLNTSAKELYELGDDPEKLANYYKKHYELVEAADMMEDIINTYPDITLECALPCHNQEKMWSKEYKKRYYDILSKADVIKYCSEFYTFRCMQDRNMYMINHSSLVIALFNGSEGGTANTLKYATEHNKEIIIIEPIQ